jgi:hypothetical protein
MKTYILTLITLSCSTSIFAQYYEYTGKATGLSIATSPFGTFHTKNNTAKMNTYSSSFEYSSMFRPGFFPTVGYTYIRNYDQQNNERASFSNPTFNDAHQISASFEIRKQLFSKSARIKAMGKCIFNRTGLLLAPEYNYLYSQQINNHSLGEIALKAGLYYYHGSNKINVSRNIIYSLYYRKGFTPLVSTETSEGNQNYYRDEIGIRVTILFREMYRFGW